MTVEGAVFSIVWDSSRRFDVEMSIKENRIRVIDRVAGRVHETALGQSFVGSIEAMRAVRLYLKEAGS